MSAAALRRRGWCPGALRPMPTGDGLLLRLRITGGIVPAALARAVAGCARRFGNGLVDLSARANLQLRGVSEATLPGLLDRLSALGLLDADAQGEGVRNVVASPLAGIDPTAILDIRPVVAGLESRFAGDPRLWGLPAKFGTLVDDGGAVGLSDVAMDLRFEAFADASGTRFRVALGGTADSARPVGACTAEGLPEAGAALALAFLDRRGTGPGAPRRMRDLLAPGASALQALLEGVDPALLSRPADLAAGPRRRRPSGPLLGSGAAADLPYLGVGAPFGRLSADGLDALARTAERFGSGELRLTPWRAVLLPGVPAECAGAATARLGPGFILHDDDPRRRVAACPGAPGCANGSTPTQVDAAALAPLAARLAPKGIVLHVSGCAKGCALPGAAPVTLVGREGRYDLVRDGTAADPPARRGLILAEAGAALAALAEGPVPA